MKALLASTLLFSLSCTCLGQNYIYRGSSKIDATTTWSFPLDNSSYAKDLNVTIGKTQKGSAIIMLSTETLLNEIGGNVILYLVDGNALLLHQRIAHDRVNDASVVLYSMLFSDLNKLKASDISTIRYSLIYPGVHDMRVESYTAHNAWTVGHIATASEIHDLFASTISETKPAITSRYTIYMRAITDHETGKSENEDVSGVLSVSLKLKMIVINCNDSTDTFYIQSIDHRRKSLVDTGFNCICTGGKEPLKFISLDNVSAKDIGYKAMLMVVYRKRTVAYYLEPILADKIN
jgi:hypothetical protein